MKIKFEFPEKVKKYIKKEKIKIKEIKEKIESNLWEDLLDKQYEPIKLGKIRIVVNGIHKSLKNQIFISPKIISKKKAFRTVSSGLLLKKYSIYYLIFKEK